MTDILTRAAALMREQAENATPGVWGVDDRTTVATDVHVTGRASFRYPRWVADLDDTFRTDFGDEDCRAEADAAHIASWDPATALAVAAWLESVAASRVPPNGNSRDEGRAIAGRDESLAIELARTYLRAAE